MPITPITLADLTAATVAGNGVFDVLMRANKAHLEQEFTQNRIKGPEYATVYLGSLDRVLQTAVTFLLEKDKTALEAQLVEQQILLAQVEVQKAQAQLLQIEKQTELVEAQIANAAAELAILQANALKIPEEILLIKAQTAKVTQETTNLVTAELQMDAEILLTQQKTTNAVTENTVLIAQECKLRAEYDVLIETRAKTTEEKNLLAQKTVTERGQTQPTGVSEDSIIGRQKKLYLAQADGFQRDAEQKAAKIMADTWNVRRTTDEGTVADGTNMLNDAAVGRAITRLLTGVGA